MSQDRGIIITQEQSAISWSWIFLFLWNKINVQINFHGVVFAISTTGDCCCLSCFFLFIRRLLFVFFIIIELMKSHYVWLLVTYQVSRWRSDVVQSHIGVWCCMNCNTCGRFQQAKRWGEGCNDGIEMVKKHLDVGVAKIEGNVLLVLTVTLFMTICDCNWRLWIIQYDINFLVLLLQTFPDVVVEENHCPQYT